MPDLRQLPPEPSLEPALDPAVLEPLVLDLLEWIGPAARPCEDVLDAWRTSCPRLPVWEEASARGWVARDAGATIRVTAAGAARLEAARHVAWAVRRAAG